MWNGCWYLRSNETGMVSRQQGDTMTTTATTTHPEGVNLAPVVETLQGIYDGALREHVLATTGTTFSTSSSLASSQASIPTSTKPRGIIR